MSKADDGDCCLGHSGGSGSFLLLHSNESESVARLNVN